MQNQHFPPRAKETRPLARETLKGQWPIAILVSFLAGILGGANSTSPNLNIDLSGLDMSKEDLAELLAVDKELWAAECDGIREFYAKFGDKLPAKLKEELEKLESKLK